MPLGYFVPANGRTGAELRVARRAHELVATGPSARLGSLLPHNTITTTLGTDGRPIEVRLSFVLALWLVLGCLVPNEAVSALFIYMHIVGAERLGAALDLLLADFDTDDAVIALTPSVLRRKLLELAVHARARDAVPFTVTAACLLVVGGIVDDQECAHLAAPLHVPALAPAWFALVTFAMLVSPSCSRGVALASTGSSVAPMPLPPTGLTRATGALGCVSVRALALAPGAST